MEVKFLNSSLAFAEQKPFEPDEFTSSAIIASGNMSMTNGQKMALQTFFTSVGAQSNSGVWAKLKKIYMPILCSDVSKSLVNYKTNNVDCVPASVYTLVERGITGTAEEHSLDYALKLESSYVQDMTDYSCLLGFSKVAYPYVTGMFFGLGKALSYDAGFTGLKTQANGEIRLYDTNPRTFAFSGANLHTTSTIGITSETGQASVLIHGKGAVTAEHSFVTNERSVELYFTASNYVGKSGKAGSCDPIDFLALGTKLTDSELSMAVAAVENLRKAFHS